MIDKDNKTRVAVTLTNDLIKVLDSYALNLGVSRSALVTFALRDYLSYGAVGNSKQSSEKNNALVI